MKMDDNTTELLNNIYDILVKYAGAKDCEHEKYSFAHSIDKEGTEEYRFCGVFGFGGKYWPRINFVTYYIENETQKIKDAAELTNQKLKELKDQWYSKMMKVKVYAKTNGCAKIEKTNIEATVVGKSVMSGESHKRFVLGGYLQASDVGNTGAEVYCTEDSYLIAVTKCVNRVINNCQHYKTSHNKITKPIAKHFERIQFQMHLLHCDVKEEYSHQVVTGKNSHLTERVGFELLENINGNKK